MNFGTEAATRGALLKELFLKISQFWQENNLECLFSKVAGLQANSIKTRRQRRCFPVNIAKFLRTPILKNVCKRVRLLTSLSNFHIMCPFETLLFTNYIMSSVHITCKTKQNFNRNVWKKLLEKVLFLPIILWSIATRYWKYTNANLNIYQYLRSHMKVLCRRFHIKIPFAFWDIHTWDMWKACVYKHLPYFLGTPRENNSRIF